MGGGRAPAAMGEEAEDLWDSDVVGIVAKIGFVAGLAATVAFILAVGRPVLDIMYGTSPATKMNAPPAAAGGGAEDEEPEVAAAMPTSAVDGGLVTLEPAPEPGMVTLEPVE